MAEKKITRVGSTKAGKASERVRCDPERTRAFRHGVDPVQLYILIAALGYFYLSNNHTLSTIFGQCLMHARALGQRLAHMTGPVLGYLSK